MVKIEENSTPDSLDIQNEIIKMAHLQSLRKITSQASHRVIEDIMIYKACAQGEKKTDKLDLKVVLNIFISSDHRFNIFASY